MADEFEVTAAELKFHVMPFAVRAIEMWEIFVRFVEVQRAMIHIGEPVCIESNQVDFTKPQVQRQRDRERCAR